MTKDELFRTMLHREMRRSSEENWAAGWLVNLEYLLWDWVLQREGDDAEILRALSELAGGWWAYPDPDEPEIIEPQFVPIGEWQVRYATRRKRMDW